MPRRCVDNFVRKCSGAVIRTATHRRQERDFVAIGEHRRQRRKLLVLRENNTRRKLPNARETCSVVFENCLQAATLGHFERILPKPGHIAEHTKKKDADAHVLS